MNNESTDNLLNKLSEKVNLIRKAHNDAEVQDILIEFDSDLQDLIAKREQVVVGRITAWLIHKINNPLGTISGNTQLLVRRLERDIEDPDKLQLYTKYTDGIRNEIDRCVCITSDLLELTRSKEAGMTQV